jgi:hypothetical protein
MSFQRTPNPSTEVIKLAPEAGPRKALDMSQQQRIAAALVKAGISNPSAWAVAGVAQSGPAMSAASGSPDSLGTGSAASFERQPPIVMMKGKNNPTFLISWRSQREIASSLGWKCGLMIWGGPALALLCLFGLLTLTHLI